MRVSMEDEDIAENTLIMWISDNGPPFRLSTEEAVIRCCATPRPTHSQDFKMRMCAGARKAQRHLTKKKEVGK